MRERVTDHQACRDSCNDEECLPFRTPRSVLAEIGVQLDVTLLEEPSASWCTFSLDQLRLLLNGRRLRARRVGFGAHVWASDLHGVSDCGVSARLLKPAASQWVATGAAAILDSAQAQKREESVAACRIIQAAVIDDGKAGGTAHTLDSALARGVRDRKSVV